MSDPQKYRTKEEVGTFEDADPIQQLVAHLIEKNLATQEQIDTYSAYTETYGANYCTMVALMDVGQKNFVSLLAK